MSKENDIMLFKVNLWLLSEVQAISGSQIKQGRKSKGKLYMHRSTDLRISNAGTFAINTDIMM